MAKSKKRKQQSINQRLDDHSEGLFINKPIFYQSSRKEGAHNISETVNLYTHLEFLALSYLEKTVVAIWKQK